MEKSPTPQSPDRASVRVCVCVRACVRVEAAVAAPCRREEDKTGREKREEVKTCRVGTDVGGTAMVMVMAVVEGWGLQALSCSLA